MASPAGRRLRPLAVVCALLLVLWGLASAGSLIAQIMDLNDNGWPDENADGEIFGWIILYLSAAASGCWVAVWGLFGLAFRPPLHFAVLASSSRSRSRWRPTSSRPATSATRSTPGGRSAISSGGTATASPSRRTG